jgi:hypothetical protein
MDRKICTAEFVISEELLRLSLGMPETSVILTVERHAAGRGFVVIVSDRVLLPPGHHEVTPIITEHQIRWDYNVQSERSEP